MLNSSIAKVIFFLGWTYLTYYFYTLNAILAAAFFIACFLYLARSMRNEE
ncbi:MAG: hypothetical protein HN584_12145 [Akkermansiaceae bacterium]|nr:hypothetical protein [Akkermansiaceae bacterium]MDG1853125.1 hypothetical protein [Verrucomicrobiales bacterium]